VGGGGSGPAARAPRVLPTRHPGAGAAAPRAPGSRRGAAPRPAAGGSGAAVSAAAGPGIVLSGDVKEADLTRASFVQELLDDGLRRVHVTAWATQAARPDGVDAAVGRETL